jgi:hypothetical protein
LNPGLGARGRGGGPTWERTQGHAAKLDFKQRQGKLRTFADVSRNKERLKTEGIG